MSETNADSPKPESKPIRTRLESPEPWKRVVKVEVSRAHFDQEYAKRLKKVVKGFVQPGFRKGKTPSAVVEKQVGASLRMETIEGLIQPAWMAGVIEHKLAPLTEPELENLEFPEDGPLSFDLTVEVRPEIEARDYDDLPVKRRAVTVTDEEVEEVLTRLQESRASFETVERAAEPGDQLKVDLMPHTAAGEPDPAKKIEDQRIVLGAETNLPAFDEGLTGAEAGQTREITVHYADDHPNEGLRGQTLTFSAEVKEVAAKKIPELNDELAAQLGEGKTLESLTQEIRDDLVKETERRVKVELDQQILRELVARNDVPVPPSMLAKYLEAGVEEMKHRAQHQGQTISDEEAAQYRESARPHAERALQGMLLLESIQKKEDIKVSDEDVEERIHEIATEHGFDVDQYRKFLESGDEKGRLEYDLLDRRTYDFLLSRARIEDVAADAEILKEEE